MKITRQHRSDDLFRAVYAQTSKKKMAARRAVILNRIMLALLAVALLLLASMEVWAGGRPHPALDGPHYAMHNGSVMGVETDGHGGVLIRYVEPRPTMWSYGVVPGTVLFVGHWNGPQLDGEANVFCHGLPIPYFVTGTSGPNGVLVLSGAAPMVTPWCDVLGLTRASDNSVLIFYPQ